MSQYASGVSVYLISVHRNIINLYLTKYVGD